MLTASPGLAGDVLALGDGSGTNNPDLYGVPSAGCLKCEGGTSQAWDAPILDVDWSIGLRGGYAISSTQGESYEGSLLPRIAVGYEGRRSTATLAGSAEIVESSRDGFRIASGLLDLSGAYELDAVTTLTGAGTLSLTQDAPGTTNLAEPQVLSGSAEVGIERQAGRFDVSARANAGREIYGPTINALGGTVDNSWDNNTSVGGGLRVTYPVTPVLATFADGSATYRYFDAASPSLGAKLDGPTYVAKVGLSYEPNTILSAEASIGVGLRRFDAGFADITATLYDARVTFRPDETLVLNAAFSTELGAPGANDPGTARVTYTATADAAYTINPWLVARASADWYRAEITGTGGIETGYGLGAGLDYRLNRQTTISADYTFSHVAPVAPEPVRDTHKFMVGVTFAK